MEPIVSVCLLPTERSQPPKGVLRWAGRFPALRNSTQAASSVAARLVPRPLEAKRGWL